MLPPVEPNKVLGVAHNYQSHFTESEDSVPDRPTLWWKGGRTVVASHGDTIELPAVDSVIYEGEIGVVIGTQCRNVSRSNAMDMIAGFTCVNDLTDQTYSEEPSMFRQKSFDGSAPIGPVLASPEHVPEKPRVQLVVNGEVRQDSADDEFVFSIADVIAAFSAVMTLEQNDVIMMGTSSGYDFLRDGDRVEVTVECVGTLEHTVTV